MTQFARTSVYMVFALTLAHLQACQPRTDNSGVVQARIPEEPDSHFTILSTGPDETVVYHFTRGEYDGISVPNHPQEYLERKLAWGALRSEPIDTSTEAGGGSIRHTIPFAPHTGEGQNSATPCFGKPQPQASQMQAISLWCSSSQGPK